MARIFSRTELALLIKQLPVFSTLSWWDRRFVADRSSVVEYKKGDIIYKEGDPPDAFNCVISGRVQIFTYSPQGKEITLEYVHRGKYFGIISLLTGDSHSVSTRAANDTVILRIDKTDFDGILKRIPYLAIHFSQSLSRRLKRKDLHTKTIFESTIISAYSSKRELGCSWYLINLGLSLKRETKKRTILVDISQNGTALFGYLDAEGKPLRVEQERPSFNESIIKEYIYSHPLGIDLVGIPHQTQVPMDKAHISAILSYLTNDYHYILVDLPHEMDEVVFNSITQADQIHLLFDSSKETLKSTKELLSRLKESVQEIYKKAKLILVEEIQERTSSASIEKLLGYSIYGTLARNGLLKEVKNGRTVYQPSVLALPDTTYSRAIRRIAREIGEVLVGLALSSGAAFGLAHIGVIKVLEEEKIPVDIVIGSSMGALISVFWASGYNAQEMERIAIKYRSRWALFSMLDFTIPRYGFLSGKRARKFLYRYLGKKTFHDVKFPVKVTACDILNKERIILDKGRLVDAVRASISIPGIFSPVKYMGRLLVDGAILSPVPVEVLTELGINKIIAVNVIPSPEEVSKVKQEMQQEESRKTKDLLRRRPWAWLWYLARRRIKHIFSPNIMDIIMNSMHAMEYILAEISCKQADIVIRPTSPSTSWFEFYNPAQLIKRGEEEARKALPKIRELLYEIS